MIVEQIDFDTDSELPIRGRFQYHLTASPSFIKSTLRVVERVSVADSTGREVRWAELERKYQIANDRPRPSDEPFWGRMYRARVEPAQHRP